jgi:anti-sigma regulatory factor (Ser/Thr protein kinase)
MVPRARAFIDVVLGAGHPGRDVARLLVSELVTNAVQHSDSGRPGGTVTVTILDTHDAVEVEVADDGSARSIPVVRDDLMATDGRGLFLVQALAADWGYVRHHGSTTVWFRVAVPAPSA